ETIPRVYQRIREESERLGIRIGSHDDDSEDKVNALHEIGATVAEFPVTVEAARQAKQFGMHIVVGAPNIVRGGSSSGNMDASELFRLGLADVICADYHAPSMLPAAFRLVDDGIVELPAAVAAVPRNPALAVGLDRLGAITEGFTADLVLVRREEGCLPSVERVIRGGRQVLDLSPALT